MKSQRYAKSRDLLEKTNVKTKGCCVKNIMTCLWITEEKLKGQLKTYLTAEIRQLSTDFPHPKLFLPLDWSSISFEDGGPLLALRTSHKILLC